MSLIFIWRRSLRGTPGVSRMLQASAGQGCGPRGSEKQQRGIFADEYTKIKQREKGALFRAPFAFNRSIFVL
jgi:hypothetical protein